jgi:hypothetical protein
MVNGRSITGLLSVGSHKPEIRHPTGLGRPERQLEPNLIGIESWFTSEMARSRTDIMTSDLNEGPMPTDCANAYMCLGVPGRVVILRY